MISIVLTKEHPLAYEVRVSLISCLYDINATYMDLIGYLKEAHWNSEGSPTFHSLHLLFDSIQQAIIPFVDVVGERIRALGGTSFANTKFILEYSKLNELTVNNSVEGNISAIVSGLKQLRSELYAKLDIVNPIDSVTGSMLQIQTEEVDKLIYLLGSCM